MMVLVAMASSAQAETPQEKAARHALNGPEIKKLKVLEHEFNVKKAKVTSSGVETKVEGQLSHHLSLRPDDQLYYTIKKSGGKVTSVDIRIDRGGLAPYIGKATSYLLSSAAGGDATAIAQRLGRFFDGKWESAADVIVATIALQVPDSSVSRVTQTPPFRSRPYGVVQPATVRDHRSR
jgi:hypothetical protein